MRRKEKLYSILGFRSKKEYDRAKDRVLNPYKKYLLKKKNA